MIEKVKTEIILDVNEGTVGDLNDLMEEIKAYTKEYEHDQVTVVTFTETINTMNERKYEIVLEIKRDTENLGRFYESEEEKLFGFYEDDE